MSFKEKFFNILNMEIGNKLNLLDLSISLKEAGLLLKSNINTAETINLLSKTSPNKNLKKIFSEIYGFECEIVENSGFLYVIPKKI